MACVRELTEVLTGFRSQSSHEFKDLHTRFMAM